MIREVLLTIDVIGLGMLLGGGVYESVVMNPNYRAEIPKSLNQLRQFMKVTTPANFFRVLSPVTIISLLATVFIFWDSVSVRLMFVASFFLLIAADSITYGFHYPRNRILFINPLSDNVVLLRRISREWQIGNLLRIILIFIALVNIMCGTFNLINIVP